MADVTEKQFSELIAEQKASKEIAGDAMQKQMDGIGKLKSAQNETTRTLARSLMSAEERAAADAEAGRQNANRVAGGIAAAETRKANADAEAKASNESQGEESSSLLSKIGKGFTSFFSFSKGSASADKETANEDAADGDKERGILGKIAGGITGLGKSFTEGAKDKAKKGLTGFMSMLKKFAIGGLMTALLLFMNSSYWEDTKKYIVDTLIPKLKYFYDAFFGPNGGFMNGINALFGDVDGLGGIVIGIGVVVTTIVGMKIFKLINNLRLAYLALKANTIKNILDPLKNSVLGQKVIALFTKMWAALKAGYIALKAATIKNILEPLKNSVLGQKVIGLFTKMWAALKAAYIALKVATIKHVLEPLKGMAVAAGGKMWALFTKMWAALKAGYIALKVATVKNVLTPLQGVAVAAGAKMWTFMRLIPPALVAIKVFFLSTMLPAITAMLATATAFMVPLLPIIAAAVAIGVVLFALKSAFDDFMTTLDKTGSIGEALKVGISKFMGSILGFIPMLVLKLVSWVASLFGFDDFAAKVDSIDPIQYISDVIANMMGCVMDWFGLLFTDPVKALTKLVSGFLGGYLDIVSWLVDMIKKPIVWLLGLFGWDDAAASVESFSFSRFVTGMLTKAKDWVLSIFSWAETAEEGDSWLVRTIKGMITGVKEWFGKMFDFGTLKSSLASVINILTWLPNLVKDAVLSVTSWLLGLFGFDKAAEKVANAKNWTIGGLIMDAVDSIIDWFKNLFDFDFSALLDPKAFVSKFLPSWMGGGPESEEDIAKAKKEEEEELAAENLARREKEAEKREKLLESRNKEAEKRQKKLERYEEQARQSQKFIDSGGKEGKDTVFNTGNDIEAEQKAMEAKKKYIAKLRKEDAAAKAKEAKEDAEANDMRLDSEKKRDSDLKKDAEKLAKLRKQGERIADLDDATSWKGGIDPKFHKANMKKIQELESQIKDKYGDSAEVRDIIKGKPLPAPAKSAAEAKLDGMGTTLGQSAAADKLDGMGATPSERVKNITEQMQELNAERKKLKRGGERIRLSARIQTLGKQRKSLMMQMPEDKTSDILKEAKREKEASVNQVPPQHNNIDASNKRSYSSSTRFTTVNQSLENQSLAGKMSAAQ